MELKFFLFILLNIKISFSIKLDLNGKWLFNDTNGNYTNLKANVPGGIYTDLISNNIIDNPILNFNDQSTKWVGRKNWTYYRNFTVDAKLLENSNINIVFEGLDTFSSIFINGKFIGNSSNMFVRYIFNIKNVLQEGHNSIEIYFLSPVEVAENLANEQNKSYTVPPQCTPADYNGECHVNQIRKMQASFSWDWGPSLASVGIWKEVYIEGFNTNVIRYLVVEIKENSLKNTWNVLTTTYLSSNSMHVAKGKLLFILVTDENVQFKKTIDIDIAEDKNKEIQIFEILEISQSSVKRWWPNGFGEQNLYNLTVLFTSGNEQDSYSAKIGFRTVELVQKEITVSEEHMGNSFYFEINGVPIFAKGSNAIPLNILPEIGQDRKLVDNLMQTAKDCNMNMLRVWGGGVYESDYYYQKADELGIMIWQDFMFACALYPTRHDFLINVVEEIRHQMRRIGSHPSIVTWAGNNENEAALTGNWYGSDGQEIYNIDYKKLYVETIKTEFKSTLNGSIFITSSPSNGIKTDEDGGISNNAYDTHYGDDHTYLYEFDSFNSNIYPIPRFSSEYGLQSYPSFSSISKSTNNISNIEIGSDFLRSRQHHPLGDMELKLLISYQLKLPSKSSQNYTNVFIFYSQVIQAVGIKTETEHYRKYRSILTEDGNGLTMGALYWQLNDVWIAPTWSGIDSTGKWKLLQYFIRDAFEQIIVIGHLTNDRHLEIAVISDKTTIIENVTLVLSVYNWTSFVPVSIEEKIISIEGSSSKIISKIDTDDYLQSKGCGTLSKAKKNCFIHLTLKKCNQSIAPENFVIPEKLKNLNLNYPDITIKSVEAISEDDKKNYRITIKTSEITLFVWIDSKEIPGNFSENGFHQINATKTIYFQSEVDITIEDLKDNLVLSHILNVNI